MKTQIYTDKHGTKLKQNDKIRFFYDIKGSKNAHAYKKGEIGQLTPICGIDMVVKLNHTSKKYYFTMPLKNVDLVKVEVVK